MTHVFSETQKQQMKQLMQLALQEDAVANDATSRAIFTQNKPLKAKLVAREPMVFAGAKILPIFFELISHTTPPASGGGSMGDTVSSKNNKLNILLQVKDGDTLASGGVFGTISGNESDLLSHERVLLNLLQRLCGVATLTRKFVDATAGTNVKILDTRKTIPGWRALDKYAVTCGRGMNHRMDLASEVMIKDNHIAAAGNMQKAIEAVLPLKLPITVECDTLPQVKEAMQFPVQRLLLDNMKPETLREAVQLVGGKIPLEASGGVTLAKVKTIAETGVDYISVGAITHSAVAVDIGLDMHD